MKCPGPQVIQTWANGGTRQVPPLWLQIHVPAMKHLMQYLAPQCRKSLSDWRRYPSSKDVQIVKHTRKLLCIDARKFHIAYFNFTSLLGPRQTWYLLHDSHGNVYHITVISLNLQLICSFSGEVKKKVCVGHAVAWKKVTQANFWWGQIVSPSFVPVYGKRQTKLSSEGNHRQTSKPASPFDNTVLSHVIAATENSPSRLKFSFVNTTLIFCYKS